MSEDRLRLAHDDHAVEVSPLGAQWCRWQCAGRERLWSGDPAWWPQHAPLLFPLVGRLAGGMARYAGGDARALPHHGFARTSVFDVVAHAADAVELRLRAGAATRACYPFDFELRVRYALTRRALDIGLEVANPGDIPLPYSIGLHPGFRIDPPGDWRLRFDNPESPEVPVIDADGLFTAGTRRVPMIDGELALTPSLLAREALCFMSARSTGVELQAPDGGMIGVRTRGFDHWALWAPRGDAPFVCIEAWTGHGDAQGFCGAFDERPSTRRLAPGGVATHGLRFGFEEGGPQ